MKKSFKLDIRVDFDDDIVKVKVLSEYEDLPKEVKEKLFVGPVFYSLVKEKIEIKVEYELWKYMIQT